MPQLAYAMCRRVDLPIIQQMGSNHAAAKADGQPPVYLRLFTSEEQALKTPFRRGEPGSDLEQGALLYVVLDGLNYETQDHGSVLLSGRPQLEPARIGVLKLVSLGNRGERGQRSVTEEERQRRSQSQVKAWETRRVRKQLAVEAIPTL